MAASFAQPRWTRRFWWLAVAVAAVVALTQAVRSGGDAQAELPVVAPQEPISQVDARLLADGWVAKPERDPLPFERRLAQNTLASLSGCSGTGMGFCRYDYQRNNHRFAVVTVPGPFGSGVVHNTFELE
jgi:hypothetical protein